MANWLNEQLKAVGVETQLADLGKQEIEGLILDLPPAILGRIGNDPKKKTILIYGHFDVQPVCSQAIISESQAQSFLRRTSRTAGTLNRLRLQFVRMVG